MRRSLFSLFALLFLCSGVTKAQRDSSRNDFTNAESWFLFEEYGEAEAIYQKLLKWDPDNDNLKYRIGICLLNDPYRKQESIDYLLEASKNINASYKESRFKERTAPPDVLFYLGTAYLVNEKLDLARKSFLEFQKIMDPEIYDEELVQLQIQACDNAKRLMSMPVDLDLQAMGSSVNTRYSETHPVISGNGERMAFITEQPFFDEALFIEKENSEWTLPMSVTSMLGFDMDIYPVAMNHDGTEMLLYYDDEHIGNLYISTYEDGFWTAAEKLGENISTKYWESHACFSKDGQTLYFTSNRKGSIGGLDIYMSEKTPDGKWGVPVNLGPEINTRYNEETPFITEDGNTLYFSSYGHYNMGGYDIFCSTRNDDGSWGEPVNLGYPINSTDDDIFFHPVNNGLGGYQSRISPAARSRHDIYYMDIYSANNPRMYIVTGFVRTRDGDTDLTTLEMFVIDPENGDTVKYNIPIAEDGSFTTKLARGDYNLHLTGDGFRELITPLSITLQSNKEKIILEEAMELDPVIAEARILEGEESDIKLKEERYEGIVGEPLLIPVKAEKGSELIVKIYQDSELVSTDTIPMDKRRTSLEIMPLEGSSIVELEMTDDNGNIHRNSFEVTGTVPVKPVQPQPEPQPAPEAQPTPEEKASQEAKASPDAQATPSVKPAISAAGAAAILLNSLQQDEENPLHATLMETGLEEEEIASPRELFEHLYAGAAQGDYSKEDVDLTLAETLAGQDAELLLKQLQENAEDPLKAYLAGLDLEKEGIQTSEDLLKHLESVAEEQGFTMDDVREAMLWALDHPLEVEKVYGKILAGSEGSMKEVLMQMDPLRDGIYTVEELIESIYKALSEKGFSDKEIASMLEELFPDHLELIENLTGAGKSGGLPVILGTSLGVLSLLLILFFVRRRKQKE